MIQYRDALLHGMHELLEVGRGETLELIKEIASQIAWESLFGNDQTLAKKFNRDCSNLLFEVTKKRPNSTRLHLEIILSLWIALSFKYGIHVHSPW